MYAWSSCISFFSLLLCLKDSFVDNLFFLSLAHIDIVLPDKPKLKFVNKVPNLKKVKKEMKKLRDIQGPARAANTFTTGQYAVVVGIFIFPINHCPLKSSKQVFKSCLPLSLWCSGHGRRLPSLGSHRDDASHHQPQDGFPDDFCSLAHQRSIQAHHT